MNFKSLNTRDKIFVGIGTLVVLVVLIMIITADNAVITILGVLGLVFFGAFLGIVRMLFTFIDKNDPSNIQLK